MAVLAADAATPTTANVKPTGVPLSPRMAIAVAIRICHRARGSDGALPPPPLAPSPLSAPLPPPPKLSPLLIMGPRRRGIRPVPAAWPSAEQLDALLSPQGANRAAAPDVRAW